jgi:hypothetical protein
VTPSPSRAPDSGLTAGETAGVAVGAVAGAVAAVGVGGAAVGAAYVVYRNMNRAADAAAALPTGSDMFVDQAAQTNGLFAESQAEFHNEMYSV